MKNKCCVSLIAIFFLSVPPSFAATPQNKDAITLSPEDLKSALVDTENEYKTTLAARKVSNTPKESINLAALTDRLSDSDRKSSPMEELAKEVDTLKNRLIVQSSTLLATQSPRKVKVRGAKTIFNFQDGALYEVTSSVDHVTDIALKPGETLTTPPTAGDTVRWNLSVMQSGSEPSKQTHIIVKPLDEDIETNLIITTDENVYQIKLTSADFHMPSVSWNYPSDAAKSFDEALKKENSQEKTVSPENLRFSYSIKGCDCDWKPIRVFDDGEKTFIQMPKSLRVTEAPALFLTDDDSMPLLLPLEFVGDVQSRRADHGSEAP